MRSPSGGTTGCGCRRSILPASTTRTSHPPHSEYARYERALWLLDVTSDIGIPAFVALSRRTHARTEDIIYGAGAHADPRLAALRALCELNQCLTWLPRPGKGDGRPTIDRSAGALVVEDRAARRLLLAGAGGGCAAPHGVALSGDRDGGHARRRGALPRARRSQGHGVPGAGSDPARRRHARGAGHRAGHAPFLGAVRVGAPLRRARRHGPGATALSPKPT